jgi:hypothetical protein
MKLGDDGRLSIEVSIPSAGVAGSGEITAWSGCRFSIAMRSTVASDQAILTTCHVRIV